MIDQLSKLQAYRSRRRSGRSRPQGRRRRCRCGRRARPLDQRLPCGSARSRARNRPRATIFRCGCSSASGSPAFRPPPLPTRMSWPNAPSRWPRFRRKIRSGPGRSGEACQAIRDLDLFDDCRNPGRAADARTRLPRKTAALAVKGVTNSGGSGASAGLGGLVLATSHGFLGQYLGLALLAFGKRHRRRGHRHGARL